MVTGNRNILNSIKGITSVVKLTAEEKTALADRVLPANVLVVDSSNIVYLTDGVTAVKALNPLLASSNNYAYDKDVVHLTGDETIAGTKTFSAAIVGSVTGNAGSATKLATARTINGTGFDGTANITTASWGTARNISITDGTNTSTAVSVNGSANVSLNLPSTIKATFVGNVTGNVTGNCSGSSGSCTGNAATATNATNSNAANQLQAFVNDNFTGGNHYVKAIRSSQGWSTHLWMCYNNGAKMADEVSVNYANSAGSANTANSATTATYATNANYASYASEAGIANSVRNLLGQKYYDIGSTILCVLVHDPAHDKLEYGAIVSGSAISEGYGPDTDGGQGHGDVSAAKIGTWVKCSGWSYDNSGQYISLLRRIA